MNLVGQEEIYKVERAAFSSRAYDEYTPVLYNGDIIFSANMRISYATEIVDTKGSPLWNIFRVSKADEENWTEPLIFADELSSIGAHYGWATFNQRGNRVFFNTNQDRVGNADAKMGIYTAGFAGGEWTGVQSFAYNDPSYNLFHPCLSPDGNMLFFSSDMRGGNGGVDLYVCTLERSTWSEPVNLGPAVNTKRHENAPVYMENGRLYFASNGHGGVGRFDIFFTEFLDGQWVAPVHLPEPLNSRKNDIQFTPLDTANMTGYVTSDRDRAGTMSIYEVSLDIPPSLFINCRVQEVNNYCFTFYEDGTMNIDTTNFMYEWVIEGNRFRSKEADYCFVGPGDYVAQLNVIDVLSGEVLFNEATYNLNIEDIEQAFIVAPDTVQVDQTIILDATETYLTNYGTNRFVWNTGDLYYQADSVISHSYYKPGTYIVKLGVIDDSRGPELTRKTCSFKRVVVIPPEQ